MKKKVFVSMLVILVALAATLGGTLAWFTAKAEVENAFQAGTVMIDVDEEFSWAETLNPENVNPGDCFKKEFTVTNTGSKYFLLRMELNEEWEYDWDWLWKNWEALCFTENDPELTKPGGLYNPDDVTEEWLDFIAYVEALTNPIKWDDIEDELVDAGFIYLDADGYWYYDGKFAPDVAIEYEFDFEVCFDGPTMTNFFQSADYTLTIRFEAIQASNNASGAAWDVNSVYDPADPQSGTHWSAWGAPLK